MRRSRDSGWRHHVPDGRARSGGDQFHRIPDNETSRSCCWLLPWHYRVHRADLRFGMVEGEETATVGGDEKNGSESTRLYLVSAIFDFTRPGACRAADWCRYWSEFDTAQGWTRSWPWGIWRIRWERCLHSTG